MSQVNQHVHQPRLSIATVIPRFRGLLSTSDGSVVGFRRHHLLKFSPPFRTPQQLATLPLSGYRQIGRVRLIERLLRLEVYRMVRTPAGTEIASSREGILRREHGNKEFQVVYADARSRRPISLCVDREGRLYFGEYFNNADRDAVRVFMSEDDGCSWRECYRFPPKTIRHVHGLIYDEAQDRLWVMTGDYGDEAQIGLASPGFGSYQVVVQGSQQTRACDGVCGSSGLIYATDTPLEQNHVYWLDATTGQTTSVANVQNSVLFMGEACGGMFLSTIVEPSDMNTTQCVHVWYSSDGRQWGEVLTLPRDRWSMRYFQYPTASFANGPRACPYVFISMRGTRGSDGKCLVGTIE